MRSRWRKRSRREQEEHVAAPFAPQYQNMFYRKAGAWEVRHNFCGKKEIVQVVSAEKSKQELEDIIDAAILTLATEQSEAVVEQWAKGPL